MKKIQVEAFSTWLGSDGVLRTIVKPQAEITYKEALENTEAVKTASGDRTRPLMVDTRAIKSITKEARDHFAMKNRKPGVSAIGVLISSPVSKIIGNFFLGLNKPAVPTRLFTRETEAISWLKKFT